MSKPSLKNFDPARVAQLDAQMWKAYYKHDFSALLRLLIALFREQFKVGAITAWRLGYYTTQAARHFRGAGGTGHARKYLQKYYRLLNNCMFEDFDPSLAAKTELEWWVIHRYPTRGSLSTALADNMATLYSLPASQLRAYGKERAIAMELRDIATHQEKGEPDWQAIQQHLEKSYTALFEAVQ